jgi:hypothetical protein
VDRLYLFGGTARASSPDAVEARPVETPPFVLKVAGRRQSRIDVSQFPDESGVTLCAFGQYPVIPMKTGNG